MSTRLARIVPNDPDSPVVKGVKVIQADGSTIRGIKKLTLVAEAGSHLWTAKIEMNVLPPAGLTAQYETTDITSEEREFASDHRLPPEIRARLAELDRERNLAEMRHYEKCTDLIVSILKEIGDDILQSSIRLRNNRP